MKNRAEYRNYGKGILSFGKHKGKTLKQIISEGDFAYVVWLNDSVARITVSHSDYIHCKQMLSLS